MKVLVVNCHPPTRDGKRRFHEYMELVKHTFRSTPNLEIVHRTYKNLDDFVYVKKETYSVDKNVLEAARLLFEEADDDGSGHLDEFELLQVVQHLFAKLGMPVKPEQLPGLKKEVRQNMEKFDTDNNGTMEFEELVSMLCVDPWRELLPADSRKKENVMLVMKSFCLLDVVLIDGDPNLLPWHEEASDLLQLVYQIVYSQGWQRTPGGSSCITMFCTAVGAQMVQYLANAGQRIVGVFNGSVEGRGQRMREDEKLKILAAIDKNQEASEKGVFLDNSTGDVWELNKKDKCWRKELNLGLLAHGSRNHPSQKYRPPGGELQDAIKTRVCRLSKKYQHWSLDGISKQEFMAPIDRSWDMVLTLPAEQTQIEVIAESERGPEILEVRNNLLCTMFSVDKNYQETCTVLSNFLLKNQASMAADKETKYLWYEWMMKAATSDALCLQYAPDFAMYRAPKGIHAKGYCPSPSPRPRNPKPVPVQKTAPRNDDDEIDRFDDADLAGGETLLSVKDLAKWNRARAGEQDPADKGSSLLPKMPGIRTRTPTQEDIQNRLERKRASVQAEEQKKHRTTMRSQSCLPALQTTKYERKKTVAESFRIKKTGHHKRRCQSPSRIRPQCNYASNTVLWQLDSHPLYIEEPYIENPKRIYHEWWLEYGDKSHIEGPFDFAGKQYSLSQHHGGHNCGGHYWDPMYRQGLPVFDDSANLDNVMSKLRVPDKGKWLRRSSINGHPIDFKLTHSMKKPTDPQELHHQMQHTLYKDYNDPLMKTVPLFSQPGHLREAVKSGLPARDLLNKMSLRTSAVAPLMATNKLNAIMTMRTRDSARNTGRVPSPGMMFSNTAQITEMSVPTGRILSTSGSHMRTGAQQVANARSEARGRVARRGSFVGTLVGIDNGNARTV